MNPAQFDFTKRRWHWHHLPPEIAEHLAEAAAADELICVKLTESRAVYRFENLFIKISGSYRLKSQLMPIRSTLLFQTCLILTVHIWIS